MAEEYRSGQGSIIPTMFIGLGGTGSRIIDHIAGRAGLLPNWDSQLRPLTTFVSIDTNELDQHKLKYIPEGNRINIAGFDKQRVVEGYRRSNDQQALQWLDKGYQPRAGIKPGAGQIRVESRLGFFYHSPEIRKRLEELVADNLRPGIIGRQTGPKKYYVYVFSTLAGGTGSGSFLPAAYLIDAIVKAQNWQPRVIGNFLLSTLLLDKVGPELHPDIHANTYAALKELENLTKLEYKQVKDEGRGSEEFVYCRNENTKETTYVETRPFFLSFILDKPPHLSLPEVEPAIADAAFLQVFTPIIDNLAGELDNYEKKLEGLTRFPGDLKDVGLGYAQNFGAFGAAAMSVPGLDLLEYCALRFAAQAIRGQITFGVDPANANDDRARALARLAVSYSEPKFLRMSDEAREGAINKSFVDSVQEMARQDKKEELLDGFWYQLSESVDEGKVTGSDEKGDPIHAESLLEAVFRKLAEARKELLNKVSIKERAFSFHREGLGQYVEYVSRLSENIRAGSQTISEGLRGLEASASEGETVADFKLDPVSERYLVIRLLVQVENVWIPAAQEQQRKTLNRDIINNANVRERLERELYESLQEAAANRPWFNRDQPFFDARNEAQQYYREVAAGARKSFDAHVQLQQLRALLEYLQKRSRQYAHLSTRMNGLVQELEGEAERYRRKETAITPEFALRVEVLETMDEPRQRIWDRAYQALFLDEGRYLGTFDRKVLAETISRELEPVIRPDGMVIEKSLDQMVADLRRALCDLGRERMRPAIMGETGLSLIKALELEARLLLQPAKPPGQGVTADEIDAYREKKFRSLEQMIDVFARVTSAESKAFDDGVTVNRTRQLIQGVTGASAGSAAGEFLERLESVLSVGGKQVKTDEWHDPHLLIVHDVELPIPLYYWQAIIGEIEAAYLQQAADERRSYHLHTDKLWEKSLPNLNPNRSEITVGWSLHRFVEGVITGVFSPNDSGQWEWSRITAGTREQKATKLGDNLSSVLYRIGEFHRNEDLQKSLEKQLAEAREKESDYEERRKEILAQFESLLEQINLSETEGEEISREEILDRPILRTLIAELGKENRGEESLVAAPAKKKSRYHGIGSRRT
ncbi:MAG: hypothetical protein GY862_27560 [Gammaproteobacteria bacterium]|nr:hypothetical protein [Gammaproteobacteria bacterium]